VSNQLLHYKEIWNLQYDGEPLTSYSGLLQPALFEGKECMLKIARREKDIRANKLMIWWHGDGAAKVWRHDNVALHGDIHHGNVLHFGERGWLAIDPKGLIGERGFDYANIFCNPDAVTAAQSGRLVGQAVVVAETAGLDRIRLLQWIAAWAGLSAARCINDKEDPQKVISIAKLAIGRLST
jgi:streptomycin 6-kinase